MIGNESETEILSGEIARKSTSLPLGSIHLTYKAFRSLSDNSYCKEEVKLVDWKYEQRQAHMKYEQREANNVSGSLYSRLSAVDQDSVDQDFHCGCPIKGFSLSYDSAVNQLIPALDLSKLEDNSDGLSSPEVGFPYSKASSRDSYSWRGRSRSHESSSDSNINLAMLPPLSRSVKAPGISHFIVCNKI